MDTFMTIQQAAKATNHSYHSIWRAISSGRLRAYKPAGKVIIAAADLEAWVKEGEIRPRRIGRPRKQWK